MRRAFLWAALLAAAPVAVGLASPSDLDRHDQGKQALYVLDAVQGHWLVQHSRGQLATKPPLYTWIAALGAGVAGLNEFTVRLPSVLASLGTGLVLLALARRLYGDAGNAIGLLAVALFATTQHVSKLAYLARTDMLLSFWIALALLCFAARRDVLFWVAVALATLTKGPFGVGIPLLAVALYALLRREMEPLRALRPLRGLTIFAALVGAWLGPAMWQHGDELWRVTFQRELFDRVRGAGSRAASAHHPFWYLLPIFVAKLLPWSLLLPFAASTRARSDDAADRGRLFLVAWILAGLALASVPASKRADYLLPVYVPAALLAAHVLWRWLCADVSNTATRWLDAGTRLWAAGLAAVAALAVPLALTGGLRRAAPPSWLAYVAGAAGFVLLVLALRGGAPRSRRLAVAIAAQGLVMLLWAQLFAAPAQELDAPRVHRFAREVQARTGGAPVEFHRAGSVSLAFLLRRNVPEIDAAELERRASGAQSSWAVLSGSAYAGLASDPERFARLGAPAIELRSEPFAHRRGDDLVLIRVGGAPPPDRRTRAQDVDPEMTDAPPRLRRTTTRA